LGSRPDTGSRLPRQGSAWNPADFPSITGDFNYNSYNNGKSEMLYDLGKDPYENRNVAGDPACAGTLANMKSLLQKRMEEAGQSPGD
jgi:hypothetical protein